MFRPLSLFIGLRYTRAKRRNHFISLISSMSMIGIALGVTVLITVLSVMNGFDREIRHRVFSMVPPITVTGLDAGLSDWHSLEDRIREVKEVQNLAPFVSGQVLLTNSNHVQPAMIDGIDPKEEVKVSELKQKISEGQITDLAPGSFGIILGEDLAARLDVMLGDKITMVTPEVSVSPAGVMPRFKRFTVVGVFSAGNGFGFDSMMAFINMQDAQKLFLMGDTVSGIHVSIQDVYRAPWVSEEIANQLPPITNTQNWTLQFGAYFHAVSMEKTMMFLILMLIIAVAVFNLVCSLVMVVNEKESDIAILRTIGATPKMIMSIFVVQGATIGILGTLLGVLGGIGLALHVGAMLSWVEHTFHTKLLSSGVYIVDYLPSELDWYDVIRITIVSLSLSLLGTLYPAWRASRTEPVEALRYE